MSSIKPVRFSKAELEQVSVAVKRMEEVFLKSANAFYRLYQEIAEKMDWNPIESAPDEMLILTKIHDDNGVNNVQIMRKSKRLWFIGDSNIYCYYTPTHWKLVKINELHKM